MFDSSQLITWINSTLELLAWILGIFKWFIEAQKRKKELLEKTTKFIKEAVKYNEELLEYPISFFNRKKGEFTKNFEEVCLLKKHVFFIFFLELSTRYIGTKNNVRIL